MKHSLLSAACALSLNLPITLQAEPQYECYDVVKRATEINRFGDLPPVSKMVTPAGLARENNEILTAYYEYKRKHGMPQDDDALTEKQKDQLQGFDDALMKVQAPLLESGWAKIYGFERIEELAHTGGNSGRLYLTQNRIVAFTLKQGAEQITYGLKPDCSVNYIYRGSASEGQTKVKGVNKETCARKGKWIAWRAELPDEKRGFEEVCTYVGGRMKRGDCVCPDGGPDWNPYINDCGRHLPEKIVSAELEATGATLYDVTKSNIKILEELCESNAGLFSAPAKVPVAPMPAQNGRPKKKLR